MPRKARIIIPGLPHHITQRGNNRQDVFFADIDRQIYLKYLAEECEKYQVTTHGYCLMTNHIHLVSTPLNEDGLACAIGRTHLRYTLYVNQHYHRSGHLWQNRFFSCPLDEEHYWTALRYMECNPQRAGMVNVAWEYAWSSAAAHVNGEDSSGLLDLAAWQAQWRPFPWREQLALPEDDFDLCQMRRHTMLGRPLGSPSFIEGLERLLGLRLHPFPVGRPRKSPSEGDEGSEVLDSDYK